MMACSMFSESMSFTSSAGLISFTRCESARSPSPPLASRVCTPSVMTDDSAAAASAMLAADNGSTSTTTWSTVSGTVSLPFRSTHVACWHMLSPSFLISSLCSVAEKKATCRRSMPVTPTPFGSLPKMFITMSRLSRPTSWSASSSTNSRTFDTSSLPLLMKSQVRCSVPTTMSTPSRTSRSCFFESTPPIMSVCFTSGATTYRLRRSISVKTCSARSLAGSSTMASGPPLDLTRVGAAAPAVLTTRTDGGASCSPL
mmetsp:Transcript_19675/g.69648  ORF Transcript_19675/g.69648 Transcript_19675/m.69648 type:complete len:257 (-) Transcript_19675:52-822(-)